MGGVLPVNKKANDNNGKKAKSATAESYRHREAESLLRPEVGVQAQFKKRKPPVIYRFDSSLAPELQWDGQNPSRERGETLIREILDASSLEDAKNAAERLRALSKPFLNWAGKAERLSFEVPTLPLFVHERLSTKGIIETLSGHKSDPQLDFDLFGDPKHSITDQVLRAYEYRDKWVNRMILGDSMAVMNSLLHFEGMGGQVQMIYIDPPYGVKFGSNFQPFVRKRDVGHGDDSDMTREPEMVKAYRDTWELGLHSYLTYLRDRLLLARELLSPSGSVFVQISDENLHQVRHVLDEIFGTQSFIALISYSSSGGFETKTLSRSGDYILWYCRDPKLVKYRELFESKSSPTDEGDRKYDQIELADDSRRSMTRDEKAGESNLPVGSRVFRVDNIVSQGASQSGPQEYIYEGRRYSCGEGSHYKASVPGGMDRLAAAKRIFVTEKGKLGYIRYWNDFPLTRLTNLWPDVSGAVQSRADPKIFAVQTGRPVVQRCMRMTTDPGDLVLDPTCGSGTTAYVAEQWGGAGLRLIRVAYRLPWRVSDYSLRLFPIIN